MIKRETQTLQTEYSCFYIWIYAWFLYLDIWNFYQGYVKVRRKCEHSFKKLCRNFYTAGGAMNNKLKILLATFILIFFAIGFFSPPGKASSPIPVEAQTREAPLRTISVSGKGEVQAQPDIAMLRLGVQTQAESAQSALDENNAKTQALMDALDGVGIPSENIQTQRFRLIPDYNYEKESETQTLIGYSVSNFIQVQTGNLDTLGVLLDLAVDAGANNIQSIRFEVSDTADLASQARQAAVEDARTKAEQLAELTGSTLGPVMNIQESSNLPEPVVRQSNFAAEAANVPIEPGNYRVQVNVNITWMLSDSSAQNQNSPVVNISPQRGQPGSAVQVNAIGFPPETEVEVGVGHWGSEYEVIQSAQTDDQGRLNTQVAIPDDAQINEEWVVVVAVESVNPNRLKVTSNRFLVTD
jgi:uncharacterized protein YggE